MTPYQLIDFGGHFALPRGFATRRAVAFDLAGFFATALAFSVARANLSRRAARNAQP